MGLLGALGRDVLVSIDGDDSGLIAKLKSANTHISQSGKEWESNFSKVAGAASAVTVAVGAMGVAWAAIATKSVAEFAKADQVWERMKAQSRALQINFTQLEPRIRSTISQLERLTGQDGEDIADAFTILLRNTNDEAKALQLLNTVVDLSAAKQITLEASATLVSKAFHGQGRALKEMGIEVRDGAQAITDLQSRVNGLGAAVGETLPNRLGYLRAALGNVVEGFGGFLAGGQGAKDMITAIGDALNRLADQLEKREGGLSRVLNTLQNIALYSTGVGARAFGFHGAADALRDARLGNGSASAPAEEQDIRFFSTGGFKGPVISLPGIESGVNAETRKKMREDEIIADLTRKDLLARLHAIRESEFNRMVVDMRKRANLQLGGYGSFPQLPTIRDVSPIQRSIPLVPQTIGAPIRFVEPLFEGKHVKRPGPGLADRFGGTESSVLLALQAIQGATSGDPLQGILGAVSSAGFAMGGPAGLGVAAGSMLLSTLSRFFGDSQQREEEIYRATLRAEREAREESRPVVNVYIPRDVFNPKSGNWRELWAATAKESGITRTGGHTFRNWDG